MADIASIDVPYAGDNPPWSYAGPLADPDYGSVFVWRRALGALELTFDRYGRRHALTWLADEPDAEIVIHGRRFGVVRDHARREAL
jgi:hypothetical protein